MHLVRQTTFFLEKMQKSLSKWDVIRYQGMAPRVPLFFNYD